MPWNDAVVVIGSCYERGRITRLLHVVIGRVRIQRLELFCGLAHPVVGCPLPRIRAGGVIAQHVEHTDRRQSDTEQIRTLCQSSAYEESAVASAVNSQAGASRVSLP